MMTIPRDRALTPLERRLIRGCAGVPGTGPRGETCGTCVANFESYDGQRRKRVKTCSKSLTRAPINDGIAACSRWEALPSRRAEIEAEEILTTARANDAG